MSDQLLLGIDVGTSGAKALLVDATGSVVASATAEYPMATPRPLWAEQDPEDWWQAATLCIRAVTREVDPCRIAGVGLTGQMHGLVLLDVKGAVLRPCIMWNDQRSGPQCSALTERIGLARLLDLTGNPVLPGFTAPKIVWVRDNEPDVYRRIAHVLLPKDYVRFRLTGALQTDVSDASGTSLLSVRDRRWSAEMLTALDVPESWLPECLESASVGAEISTAAATATGLARGTPVVGGAGDQAAGAVGNGIVREGIVSATLGTSGVVFASSNGYRAHSSGRLHAFCHAVPNRWHLMGVMLSAAGSLRWFRDALGQAEVAQSRQSGVDVYDLLTAEAAAAPVGCEGLIFLPYLTGERTPHPDPNARGVFFGLTLRHGKSHMVRSVLEGIAYGLRDSLELMRELGLPVSQLRVSGGGARSPLWRQILADVFDAEIAIPSVTEGAPFGAALLAGVGVRIYSSVEDACDRVIRVVDRVEPGPGVSVYADYYPIYRDLYPVLADGFRRVGAVAGRTVVD